MGKESSKKRKGGLKYTIPAMSMGPLFFLGILAMFFCGFRFTYAMYEKVETE